MKVVSPGKLTTNWIALACILCCVNLTAFIFWASRTDPGLRLAVLVAATNTAASLISIASTLLVGHDVGAKPNELNDVTELKKKEENVL